MSWSFFSSMIPSFFVGLKRVNTQQIFDQHWTFNVHYKPIIQFLQTLVIMNVYWLVVKCLTYLFLDHIFIFSNAIHEEQNHMCNSHTNLGRKQRL